MPAGIGYGPEGMANLQRMLRQGQVDPAQAQGLAQRVMGQQRPTQMQRGTGPGGPGMGPRPQGPPPQQPGGNAFASYNRAPMAGAPPPRQQGITGPPQQGMPGMPPGASPDMGFGPIMALLMEHLRRQQQQQQYGAGRSAMRQALTGGGGGGGPQRY